LTDGDLADIESPAKTARSTRYARWLVRFVLLVAAVVALLPVLSHTRVPVVVPALSPFVAIASVMATRSLPVIAWIGLAVAVVAVGRRRWFCRWVCPTGTCADVAARAGLRLGRRCPRLFPLGQWIAWVTLGGAILGYPLFLWLDPLALFSGLFGVTHRWSSPAGWWSGLGLAVILLVSGLWPGLWCVRICPLGAVQDGLAVCGKMLRSLFLRSEPAPQSEAARGLPRRTVLGVLAGVCWTGVVRPGRASAERPLRPPGALDEARFVGVCIRCGNCLRACPTDIIRLDQGEHSIAGLLTPRLDFRDDYCREDCARCTEVCPSGALTALTLEDKQHTSIGFPRVDMSVCLLGDDRECAACRNWCPYEAIKLVFCETEYTLIPQVDPERCPGCGACEVACPTRPTKAIVVAPRD
jgi:ferredoxin-type protein NapF